MTFDDYKQAVKADAIEAIQRGDYDYCKDFEQVNDDRWIDDSVTGNGSGSYTFNTEKAKENTAGLIWDDEFIDECAGMGLSIGDLLKKEPEALDVSARCFALGYVSEDIREAWEEYREDSAA